MPGDARRRCIRNALRLAKHKFLLVDIWPGFEPNEMMLSGEPYVLDYLRRIDYDIRSAFSSAWSLTRSTLIPGHVTSWRLDVNNPPSNSVDEPSGTFMP